MIKLALFKKIFTPKRMNFTRKIEESGQHSYKY